VRSLAYFRFYVVLAFIFLIMASLIGIFLPIWEARDLIFKFLTGDTFKEFIDKSFRGGSRCARCSGQPSPFLRLACLGVIIMAVIPLSIVLLAQVSCTQTDTRLAPVELFADKFETVLPAALPARAGTLNC
jgi:hypothetical protein